RPVAAAPAPAAPPSRWGVACPFVVRAPPTPGLRGAALPRSTAAGGNAAADWQGLRAPHGCHRAEARALLRREPGPERDALPGRGGARPLPLRRTGRRAGVRLDGVTCFLPCRRLHSGVTEV